MDIFLLRTILELNAFTSSLRSWLLPNSDLPFNIEYPAIYDRSKGSSLIPGIHCFIPCLNPIPQ